MIICYNSSKNLMKRLNHQDEWGMCERKLNSLTRVILVFSFRSWLSWENLKGGSLKIPTYKVDMQKWRKSLHVSIHSLRKEHRPWIGKKPWKWIATLLCSGGPRWLGRPGGWASAERTLVSSPSTGPTCIITRPKLSSSMVSRAFAFLPLSAGTLL